MPVPVLAVKRQAETSGSPRVRALLPVVEPIVSGRQPPRKRETLSLTPSFFFLGGVVVVPVLAGSHRYG